MGVRIITPLSPFIFSALPQIFPLLCRRSCRIKKIGCVKFALPETSFLSCHLNMKLPTSHRRQSNTTHSAISTQGSKGGVSSFGKAEVFTSSIKSTAVEDTNLHYFQLNNWYRATPMVVDKD